MAMFADTTSSTTRLPLMARLGKAFSTYMNAVARTDEVERLNSLSDEALAKRGLRREDIVRYVYRDRLAF